MQRLVPQIAYYLEMFRGGDADNAFHGLLEINRDVLPELMEVFRRERDIGVREFLVEVIWECRERSVIPFLGEALSDAEPRIWRQALNGLVTLASPAALDVLRAARIRQLPTPRETEEFRRWLEEAIEQAETVYRTGEGGILPAPMKFCWETSTRIPMRPGTPGYTLHPDGQPPR